MKYDLYSDLHIDVNLGRVPDLNYYYSKKKGSKVAVVAGDTANLVEHTIDTIEEIAEVYDHVVFVDGSASVFAHRDWIAMLIGMLSANWKNVILEIGSRMKMRIYGTAQLKLQAWSKIILP